MGIRWKPAAVNAATVVVSIVLTFVAIEAALRLYAGLYDAGILASSPEIGRGKWARAESRHWLLTQPEEWKHRQVSVPGASYAFYLQGVLHVLNDDYLRWSRPFPPKGDDSYRIMVVGDSFTFGTGIAEEDRFSNLVEKWLSADFRIELLNIGHSGYNSEDILAEIKKYLPVLRPNLVLYGVCLNDFLPSGVRPYPDHPAHPFPLPEAFENWMIAHTYVGSLLNDLYDKTLRRFHLRNDFYDDIMGDFSSHQRRFADNVKQMNEVVLASNLPPLIAMVLDQFPDYQGRGYRVAQIAEEAFARAGAEVIPSEPFYRAYSGRNFSVSRWVEHPNEEANWLWAEMISDALRHRRDLKPFAKTQTVTLPH